MYILYSMGKHQKPVILYEGKYKARDLERLRKEKRVWKLHDIYESQLAELFEITYPQLKHSPKYQRKLKEFVQKKLRSRKGLAGNWLYLPWSGHFIHTVTEQEYNLIRTNRNRNLITEEEQKKLLRFCVGIVGLSVGNSIAVGLAYQGISRSMKLAERDVMETSNLNRIRAGLHDVGVPKINIAAQQIYEINPYAKLYLFEKGLDKKSLKDFFNNDPKPKVVFDEILLAKIEIGVSYDIVPKSTVP